MRTVARRSTVVVGTGLAACVVLAACLLLVIGAGGKVLEGSVAAVVVAVVVVAVVVVAVVLVRLWVALRENRQLWQQVEAREDQLEHQACHDYLTGLPNRALFSEEVSRALDQHRTEGRALAVLFCDLDNFKMVNDTLGQRAGDGLLIGVAERLRGAVRSGDTLARLGGDEFAILVQGADPTELGWRIERALRAPFTVDGKRTSINASIGISTVSAHDATPPVSLVLSDADTAMYAVKRSGKSGVLVYDASMRQAGAADFSLQQAVSDALLSGNVHAVFQPIFEPFTGRVHAMETLARWERDGVPVPPSVFVAMAERLGLVQLLTDRMLERGVGQLAQWSSMLGHHNLRVSVNVSATELGVDGMLLDRVSEVLSRYTVRSDQLILEITESAVATNPHLAGRVLSRLRDLGVHIALDDFGTGHSSLSRLKEFPIEYLKLDAALIAGIEDDETQALILRSMTELGQGLNMAVIAEGVATSSQLARLRAISPSLLLQGFALSPPAAAKDLTRTLLRGADLAVSGGVR